MKGDSTPKFNVNALAAAGAPNPNWIKDLEKRNNQVKSLYDVFALKTEEGVRNRLRKVRSEFEKATLKAFENPLPFDKMVGILRTKWLAIR